ncbi:hypothetical protein KPL71_008441 [Citrus sinensis]|uniref:Uncharacterized protein n=1 Tax=Citrus sinensis TaxID=2711 RepID=A0ACB8M6S2_CITSI|nr:hypothetical protein KPL71_008441 [Citrus sinensis]
MPLTKNEVEEDIPKPSWEWNELKKRKASLNSKAMNALFCALDKKEFHRVSSCESANEIWHKFEVVYEGMNQVKESKISRYTRQYELFQMEQNESVYSMYTRFTDIVNTLGALGKTFSNSEKVKKIIRSLPKEWRQKRTAIEKAKDLNILPIDDLIGSLISYEKDLVAEKGNEEKKKSIDLKASKHESDEESELDEEEMDMLARRFRKLFKKSSERRKFKDLKNRKEKKEVIKCYECKKPGHIRTDCPLLNKLKKKAMVATWDDSDEETSDDEEHQEMTNLALMAIGDESDDELDEVNDLSTYDELYDAFKELHDNWIKIAKRSLPYASIITQILKFFRVPITEPISLNSRELGDEAIANLGFYWRNDRWYKDQRNKKVTELAPTDHRFFNDVRPPHLLPNLSAPHRSHPPPSEGPSHSTSADSEDPLQQLLTKVDSLSERQDKLQSQLEAFHLQSISERERLFAQQQQQLLDGQQQLFAALGFPPPSSSSHPPSL